MKILIAQLKQETASFNPMPTTYDDFAVLRGDAVRSAYAATDTELAGALEIFAASGLETITTTSANAVSGGAIVGRDLDRLIEEVVGGIAEHPDAHAAYICLHGAMAGEDEGDPEGRALVAIRELMGSKPVVVSLDLHAVLTDRMVRSADVIVPYHTYPHVDQYSTGQRAAKTLLRLLNTDAKPCVARVELPMLVRGDELITSDGQFGDAISICRELELSSNGLAAGVLIGNPFTDVPALQSNVLVTTDGDLQHAEEVAERVGRFMWERREIFQAELTSLTDAIRLARETVGLTVFSDAADATASGASGDSNAILKGLLESDYSGSALLAIVDAPAVDAAFTAGVGATLDVALGGTRDPGRFTPLTVNARVKSLHDGSFQYENGSAGRAGHVAVLVAGQVTVLVSERSVFVVGRRVFQDHGLEPALFDLVVVKSPNGFRPYYEQIAARIVPVDVPGSTSANLHSLPFQQCVRPIFPLDEAVPSPF